MCLLTSRPRRHPVQSILLQTRSRDAPLVRSSGGRGCLGQSTGLLPNQRRKKN